MQIPAIRRGLAVLGLLSAFPCLVLAQVPPGRRPAEYGVTVEKNVMIPVRDGIRLAADIYRPARDGKAAPGRFPALLTRTPYDKGGAAGEGKYYAERGYVVVANDTRGRYASEGTWHGLADDPQDGYDVVEWIAAQEWSDGKVGTFGTSYPGGTQHALAEMSPPHLTTMVPIDALSNCGVSGMRHGGCLRASVHELDLPDGRAQQQGRAGESRAPAGPDRERPADPRARRQPAGPQGHDTAAGGSRVRRRGWSRRCAAAPRRPSGISRACRWSITSTITPTCPSCTSRAGTTRGPARSP